mgnify:CR=1 FL=1
MKSISAAYYRFLLVLCAALLATWCSLYLPGAVKIYGFALAFVSVLAYTIYASLTDDRRFSIKGMWKELFDALYGF